MNGLASVVRGTGNMLVPALVIFGGVFAACSSVAAPDFRHRAVSGARHRRAAVWHWFFLTARGVAVLGWYVMSGRNLARLRPHEAALADVP